MGKVILIILFWAASVMGQQMTLSGIEFVKHNEAYVGLAYWDPYGECWTYGYGYTVGVKKGDYISQTDALKQLMNKIDTKYLPQLRRRLTRELPPYQFDACGDIVWNRGSMTDEMYYAVNTNNTARAIYLFKQRNYSVVRGVKVVVKALVIRREEMTQLYTKGVIEKKWYLDWKRKTGFTY